MRHTPDPKLIRKFNALINDKAPSENAIQRFLEKNTAFLETPHLLQGVFLNCIVTKLSVGPWKTDFVYLSKDSGTWNIVLVELKLPNKKIFADGSKHLAFSSDFNKAIAQIQTWRDQWATDSSSLLKQLEPLMVPAVMRSNVKRPHYVLVIGRDDELKGDEARRRRLVSFSHDMDLRVMTYDTLLRCYEERRGRHMCVLSPTARGFSFKEVNGEPEHIFAHATPRQLTVSAEAEKKLVKMNFSIASWRKGEPLIVNNKWTEREADLADRNEETRARPRLGARKRVVLIRRR